MNFTELDRQTARSSYRHDRGSRWARHVHELAREYHVPVHGFSASYRHSDGTLCGRRHGLYAILMHLKLFAAFQDTILRPALTDEEIEETRAAMDYEAQEVFSKPEWRLPELVHQTAFRDNTLGHPQLCAPESLSGVNRTCLEHYRRLFYRPQNMVVAGVGLDHGHLRELAELYFGDMASDASSSGALAGRGASSSLQPLSEQNLPIVDRSAARYTGGTHIEKQDDLPFTQLALAFPGAAFVDDDLYAISTLQVMLGGGDSFSAGGPGKGMYSRLYTNVLNRYVGKRKKGVIVRVTSIIHDTPF